MMIYLNILKRGSGLSIWYVVKRPFKAVLENANQISSATAQSPQPDCNLQSDLRGGGGG